MASECKPSYIIKNKFVSVEFCKNNKSNRRPNSEIVNVIEIGRPEYILSSLGNWRNG